MNFLARQLRGHKTRPFTDLQNIEVADENDLSDDGNAFFGKGRIVNNASGRSDTLKPSSSSVKKPTNVSLNLNLEGISENCDETNKENQYTTKESKSGALSSRSPKADDRFQTSRLDAPLSSRPREHLETVASPPVSYSLPTSRSSSQTDVFASRQTGSHPIQATAAEDDVIDVESAEEEDLQSVDEDEEFVEHVFSKTRHNRVDEVKAALEKGFDVNTRDQYGNTLLHICAQNNHTKLANMLVRMCPNIHMSARNLKMLTPLDFAERYKFARMVEWLRERGAQSGSSSQSSVRAKFR